MFSYAIMFFYVFVFELSWEVTVDVIMKSEL